MIVYPARDIRPFIMYYVNGKPRSSLLIESTDSMIQPGKCRPLSTLELGNAKWHGTKVCSADGLHLYALQFISTA